MLGIVMAFVCATVARTVTTPFNYPFDTIRRRMMLDSEKPAEERMYKSAVDCFIKVAKNEGPQGVYKGLIPELFRGLGGPLASRPTTVSSSSCWVKRVPNQFDD